MGNTIGVMILLSALSVLVISLGLQYIVWRQSKMSNRNFKIDSYYYTNVGIRRLGQWMVVYY